MAYPNNKAGKQQGLNMGPDTGLSGVALQHVRYSSLCTQEDKTILTWCVSLLINVEVYWRSVFTASFHFYFL